MKLHAEENRIVQYSDFSTMTTVAECRNASWEDQLKLARLLAAAPMLYEALEDVAQALAWQAHGECRGYSEKLLNVNDALEAAKAALAAAK